MAALHEEIILPKGQDITRKARQIWVSSTLDQNSGWAPSPGCHPYARAMPRKRAAMGSRTPRGRGRGRGRGPARDRRPLPVMKAMKKRAAPKRAMAAAPMRAQPARRLLERSSKVLGTGRCTARRPHKPVTSADLETAGGSMVLGAGRCTAAPRTQRAPSWRRRVAARS